MPKKKRSSTSTTDAVEILHRRYVRGRPRAEAALEGIRINLTIAQEIYRLRTKAGLTQKELAKMIGTAHSVISRLEDAAYEGHSIKMLQRISAVLNLRLEVRFVAVRSAQRKISA